LDQKKRTVILGLVFLALLAFAYVENMSFFGSVGNVFLNPPLAVLFVFVHNVLVVSLILIGMTFYVGLVLNFFPQRTLVFVILLSTPNAVIEGYGIFKTIEKTLERRMTLKALAAIYLIFFVAAVIEVGYVYLLRAVV